MSEEQLRRVTIGEPSVLDDRITLVEYRDEWPHQFERQASHICGVLGDRVIAIHHIGSTSVPGMIAKPIIDMLLVVENSADEHSYVPALESAGYLLRIREPDWHEHRLLKGGGVDLHLHVFSDGSDEVRRHLAFRDRLRTNRQDRELYARTKRELAARHWKYSQDYADAKSEVIAVILQHAADGNLSV